MVIYIDIKAIGPCSNIFSTPRTWHSNNWNVTVMSNNDHAILVWQVRTRTNSHVMEGICTAGALEEGEVVWQVRTRKRILHTQTHMTTAALHM